MRCCPTRLTGSDKDTTMAVLVIDDRETLFRDTDTERLESNAYRTPCVTTGEWFRDVLLPILTRPDTPTGLLFLINVNFSFGESAKRSLRHGIELLEHIRLTRELPAATRFASTVLYSFEHPLALHRNKAANLIVYSPGTVLLRLPEHLQTLLDPSRWQEWKSRLPVPDETALRPYVKAADEADLRKLYAHSYRNRVGVLKFCSEFAGDRIRQHHPFLDNCLRAEMANLELKRLLFLMPQYAAGSRVDEGTVIAFAEKCEHHRFLYIDDEHWRGWSLALQAGIAGIDLNPDEYGALCDSDRATTSDEQLHVIRTFQAAELFLEGKRQEVRTIQKCWADAEQAKAALQKCEERVDEAERLRQGADDRLKKTANELQRMRGSGTFKRPDILNQEHKVSKAEQELNEAEEALRAVKNAKQEAECRLSEAHETCNNAVQLISEVLPFSAVLLDLRLDPQVDQLVGFEWLTGFQLLRQLKDRFPHVPVILLTASERARSAEFAVKLGAEAYWTKGVSSGEDLRQVILRCVNKAPNRKRWAKLKVIEGKPSVHCRRLPGPTDIWLDRRMPRRGDLQAFLDEAFLIICTHAGRSENEHVLPRPWNAVFRGLGVVQEIRCQNVEGEWDQMGREEREYRERRNKFTHVPFSEYERCPEASEEEALAFFDYTLDQLLM